MESHEDLSLLKNINSRLTWKERLTKILLGVSHRCCRDLRDETYSPQFLHLDLVGLPAVWTCFLRQVRWSREALRRACCDQVRREWSCVRPSIWIAGTWKNFQRICQIEWETLRFGFCWPAQRLASNLLVSRWASKRSPCPNWLPSWDHYIINVFAVNEA